MKFLKLIVVLLLMLPIMVVAQQIPAFPGAAGGGMYTTGGRGAKVS